MQTFDRILGQIERAVIGFLLIAASFILFVNVIARYGFNSGFTWAEEATRYAIVWMVFVGSSVAAKNGVHIGVDVLIRMLAGRPAQRYIVAAVGVICVLFSIFLVIFGASLAAHAYEVNQVTPAMHAPLWVVQSAVTVGGILMTLRFAQRLVADWRGHTPGTVAVEMLG